MINCITNKFPYCAINWEEAVSALRGLNIKIAIEANVFQND